MDGERSVTHWKIGASVDVFDLLSPAEPGTMHCHATVNIGAVLEGRATLEQGGMLYQQPVGSTVLLNAFEAHASDWHGQMNRYFVLCFKEEIWSALTARFRDGPGRVRLDGPITQDQILFHSLLGLRAELLSRPDAVQVEDLTAVLGLFAARGFLVEDEALNAETAEELRRRLVDLQDAPEGQFATRIGDLAEDFGLSRFQLSRLVRASTGMQPRRLRLQLMVATAQADIAAGLSLASAAMRAGFSDQSHMNREFRRTLGMTPRDYQRLAHQQG